MNVQPIIFGLYFLVVFAIGWYSLRRTKNESDYWIAGGKLGWGLGGATMAATHTSAGTFIGTIGVIYTVGWSFGWILISIPLGYWLMVSVLAPRFTKVKELTLPAYIETRYYSKTARGIAAVIILIASVVYIQAQVVSGGLIANIVLGLPFATGMTIFTIVLLVYTLVGGMIAVVYTDFLQLVVMCLGILFAVPFTVRHFDSFEHMLMMASLAKPETFQWDAVPLVFLFTMGLAFFLSGVSAPEKLIRLYTMKDMRTIRRGVLFAIIVVCALNLLVFLMAIASISLFPSLPSGDLAMPLLANSVLPPVLGAIMLAAITAAMMSTVDSLLLVAGAAFSEDIYTNLFSPKATTKQRLKVARVGILVVGFAPLILIQTGVGEGELVQFIVVLFTALMAASFCVPVMLGVLWRRATKEGAIAAMVGGVTVTMLWEAWGPAHIDPVFPGFLVSLFLMIVVSLATPPPPIEATAPYFD